MRIFEGYTWIQKVVLIIWLLMVLTIPFHKVLSSPLLILSFIIILFSGNYRSRWMYFTTHKRWMIFAALYLLVGYAYLRSTDKQEALRDANVKLYLLLIPVFMAAFGQVTQKAIQTFLNAFVFACAAFGVVALGIALYDFIRTGENHFYYKYLVDFTFIHPSYIAMFMVFAMIVIAREMITGYREISSRRIWVMLIAIAFFMLFVLLLTAKIAIASMFLALTIAFIVWGRTYLGWKRTAFIAVIGNLVLFLAMMALPYTRQRMLMLLHYNEVSYTNSVDSREEIWKAVGQVADDHLWLGVGSGDAQQVLINQYAENGFTTGVEERYNAHNAYFQALVETGLPGMLFFLGFFLVCLWLAWKDKNYLWGAFLLLFMVNITTESMLKTQSGVVFFSFFNALLGLNSSRKRG